MRGEDGFHGRMLDAADGSPPHARGRRPTSSAKQTTSRITPACAGKTVRIRSEFPQMCDHPRMRGEDGTRGLGGCSGSGITPACAGKTGDLLDQGGVGQDHPRMRGEDGPGEGLKDGRSGSPPHARGRRHLRIRSARAFRITPACAGKTFLFRFVSLFEWDHPRMRGEDAAANATTSIVAGSPPHARGRRFPCIRVDEIFGITPACAGKTSIPPGENRTVTDHPRMRGEDVVSEVVDFREEGSPPHARGRPTPNADFRVGGGITPACAGKTRRGRACQRPVGDHPRMRGEDANGNCIWQIVPGSPPHARGRRRPCERRRRRGRITPACAGKTVMVHTSEGLLPDHPRMRGEDGGCQCHVPNPPGSPPHARGRLHPPLATPERRRITPACAGKTWRADSHAGWESDHPRMRGEDEVNYWMGTLDTGSPPHARGRRVDRVMGEAPKGITPACVGKTVH